MIPGEEEGGHEEVSLDLGDQLLLVGLILAIFVGEASHTAHN